MSNKRSVQAQPVSNTKKTTKEGTYQLVIRQITGIFMPIINYLTAASILKSVLVLLLNFGLLL